MSPIRQIVEPLSQSLPSGTQQPDAHDVASDCRLFLDLALRWRIFIEAGQRCI